MTKRVLDVGNCTPDHAAIRRLIEQNFDAQVIQAHGPEDTLAALQQGRFDLVLVNRKLDRDYSDGLVIIKQIKADLDCRDTPVMMITNFAEHQQAAKAAGAEPGFGKLALDQQQTRDALARFLA